MTTRTLIEIANACGASLEGGVALQIRGPANLRDAEADEVSFCANQRFRAELERTRAGAVLVANDMPVARKDLVLLRCADPSRAFSRVVAMFAPPRSIPVAGVHPSAVVEAGCELGAGVSIGPLCHVSKSARIAARAVLHAQVEVGADCEIGEDCELFPGVVLYPQVRLGARCVIHAGTVLGSDGHGFEPSSRGWIKIPQCGGVLIEEDVEIGANTTIDRARFGVTRIGRGTKIDNLVHIAHNVCVGEGSMIVAQVGIAGSTRIGRAVIIGGQAGLGGHLEVGDAARIGGQSGVMASIAGGGEYWGTPARLKKETLRNMAYAGRAEELGRRVLELERRLAVMEAGGALNAPGSSQQGAVPTNKEI